MTLGPNGLTKAWRNKDGDRCLTVREAAEWGATFTLFLGRNWVPKFFYASIGCRGHWARCHWRKKAA